MTSQITTHVLDATAGAPAVAVAVVLTDAEGNEVARGVTDDDGRLSIGPDVLPAGDYTIAFATGPYFSAQRVDTFYPSVAVSFTVDSADRHYHVPLLLSPFAYSTYRGS